MVEYYVSHQHSESAAIMDKHSAASEATTDFVEGVYHFNRLGQVAPPGNFNADRVGFYTGMQMEELAEKLMAVSVGILTVEEREALVLFAKQVDKWGKGFKEGNFLGAILRSDRENLLDADVDIAVVTLGSAMYQTPMFRAALQCVNDANMAKFPGGIVSRDPLTNKILKPAGWIAPDLTPFVEKPID